MSWWNLSEMTKIIRFNRLQQGLLLILAEDP